MTMTRLTFEDEGLDRSYDLTISYLQHPETENPEKHLYEVQGRVDLGTNVGPQWIWSDEKVDLDSVKDLEDLPGTLGRQVIDLIYEKN